MGGVLVEAGGESDAVGKHDAHRFDRRGLRRGEAREAEARRGVEAGERRGVRAFRIEREESGPEQRIEHDDRPARAARGPRRRRVGGAR